MLLGAFKQKEALLRGLLCDCENFAEGSLRAVVGGAGGEFLMYLLRGAGRGYQGGEEDGEKLFSDHEAIST